MGVFLVDSNGIPITSTVSGPIVRLNTDAEVTVNQTLGFDDFADAFFRITNSGAAGDTIRVKIDGGTAADVTTVLTATEAGDEEKAAILVANTLNANGTFTAKFEAKALCNLVFLISDLQGECGEFADAGDVNVTTTGGTTVQIDTNNDKLIRRSKQVLVEADSKDNRFGRIGVFGEVGAISKADNPINVVVRKTLATSGETIFVDKTVPAGQRQFIVVVAVADDVAAEFNFWDGQERDRIETWIADGTLFTQVIGFMSLKNSAYQILVVNNTGTYTEGVDYVIEDSPNDETKSQVRWIRSSTKPANGHTVKLTYDAVIRRAGIFVQASSTESYEFGAPVKIEAGKYYIVSVSNKSANSSVVIANVSGFFEVL